jgi:hypothetical protein
MENRVRKENIIYLSLTQKFQKRKGTGDANLRRHHR